MKIRDIVLLSIGVISMLVFMGFMFDYYLKIEETQLIKKNIWYDSLLLEEQKELKQKDSIIFKNEQSIKGKLNNHEYRLNKLEKGLELSK
jgi:biopolymer transport protein ExbB/TolQ